MADNVLGEDDNEEFVNPEREPPIPEIAPTMSEKAMALILYVKNARGKDGNYLLINKRLSALNRRYKKGWDIGSVVSAIQRQDAQCQYTGRQLTPENYTLRAANEELIITARNNEAIIAGKQKEGLTLSISLQ